MSVMTANPCNPAAARVAEYHNNNPLETIPGETAGNPIIEEKNSGKTAQRLEAILEGLSRFGLPYAQWLAIYRGIVTNGYFVAELAVRPVGNPGLPGYTGDDVLTPEQCLTFETSEPRGPETMLSDFRAAGLGDEIQLSEVERIVYWSGIPKRVKRGRRFIWLQKQDATWVRHHVGTKRDIAERQLQNALKFTGLKLKQVTFHRPAPEICRRDETCNPTGPVPGFAEPVCMVHNGRIVALIMPMEV